MASGTNGDWVWQISLFPKHAPEYHPVIPYTVEVIGFLAAGMTVTAFACKHMLLLRITAIVANGLFIVYGGILGLVPILALHCVLLPLNVVRLAEFIAIEQRRKAAEQKAADVHMPAAGLPAATELARRI